MNVFTTAYNFLVRSTAFLAGLCGRKPERVYDWEERLGYVEAGDEDDDSSDEGTLRFDRSCGVSRYQD